MKFTTITLLSTLATLCTAGDQSWNLRLYENENYSGQIENMNAIGGRSCINLRAPEDNKTRSIQWIAPNCKVTLYDKAGCRTPLTNWGYGSKLVQFGSAYKKTSAYSVTCR